MPESASHALLVSALVGFAESELGAIASIAIRDDAVLPIRGERPPRVYGYVPDLYATDVPTTSTLIGEAKTRSDLETTHTQEQISAFLKYLSQTPNGIFALSVPLSASATARRMLSQLKSPFSNSGTRTFILDGLKVTQC